MARLRNLNSCVSLVLCSLFVIGLLHTVVTAPAVPGVKPNHHGHSSWPRACEESGGTCIKQKDSNSVTGGREGRCPVGSRRTDLSCPGNKKICCMDKRKIQATEWYTYCGTSVYADAGAAPQTNSPNNNYDDNNNNNNDNNINNVNGFPSTFQKNSSMIVGGVEARPGELPWQILITHNGILECGATLLDDQWILTAAHCMWEANINLYKAVLGEHDRQDPGNPNRQTVAFLAVHIHPDYNPSTKANDLALVQLSTPVTLSEYVGPVCAPNADVPEYMGFKCLVSGWGITGLTGGNAAVLMYASVNLIFASTCSTMYQGQGTIHTHNICAGGDDGQDACSGDSGGPLVCNVDGLFQLLGVVSWGKGCGDPRYPGVYTAVPYFLDWIDEVRAG